MRRKGSHWYHSFADRTDTLSNATGGRGGWSSDGCSVKDRRLNETICTCSHLTSFGVLLVISPHYLALGYGSEG